MAKKPEQSIGEHLVIENDYSVKVKCSNCGIWEAYPTNSKQANLLVQREEMAKTWICASCYRKPQNDAVLEQETAPYQEHTIQDRIHWGQSWNLAVATLSEIDKKSADIESTRRIIQLWQVWFYEQLKNNHK